MNTTLNQISNFIKVADPDLVNASKDADILIFVLPHAFVSRICQTLKGKIKSNAIAISLIKVSPPVPTCVQHDNLNGLFDRVLENFPMEASSLFLTLSDTHLVLTYLS